MMHKIELTQTEVFCSHTPVGLECVTQHSLKENKHTEEVGQALFETQGLVSGM